MVGCNVAQAPLDEGWHCLAAPPEFATSVVGQTSPCHALAPGNKAPKADASVFAQALVGRETLFRPRCQQSPATMRSRPAMNRCQP